MSKIAGKVCIVTGGGGGIGRALCEALAAAGARAVYVVDIHARSAKEVSDSLPALATDPNFRSGHDVADVGKEDDIQRILHAAWSALGVVDAFFSNAGIFVVGGITSEEVSNENWDKIWRVNVLSHIYAARHLFPLWKQNGHRGGIFVITGSAAGLLMQVGCLPYHVTKHAAVSIADWLAVAHHEEGVEVHCLCPQAVRTDMLTSSAAELMGGKKGDIPAGGPAGLDGIAEPMDVANATLKGIDEGTFLILPHPRVHTYFVRKATDYDRWIKGMRRVKKHFDSLLAVAPGRSRL